MKLKYLIRIIVSAAMIFLVLSVVDLTTLLATLRQLSTSVLALMILGYLAGQLLSAYKWMVLTRAGGLELGFVQALRAYAIGMFMNSFGLGLVGGDVARGLLIAGGSNRRTTAIASVIADRAHGLGVLALLGLLATLMPGIRTIDGKLLLILIVIVLTVLLAWTIGPRILLKILPPSSTFRERALAVSQVFPTDAGTIVYVSILSLVFHLSQIGLHGFMANALGLAIPWSVLLTTIPFINILCTLPISWNGLGVRENGYIFFLSPLYLSAEQAVAFGALWLVAVIASSAIGGVVAVWTGDLRRMRSISGESQAEK